MKRRLTVAVIYEEGIRSGPWHAPVVYPTDILDAIRDALTGRSGSLGIIEVYMVGGGSSIVGNQEPSL